MKKRFGFIFPPGGRLTGASGVNKNIFEALNKEFGLEKIIPDTDYYSKIHVIGSLLNYFTLYRERNNYNYVLGISFATLPFISSTKVIQHFHSLDTGSYTNVLNSINNNSSIDKKIMDKWLGEFKDILSEKIVQIETRKKIANITEKCCSDAAVKIITVSPSVKRQLVSLFGINSRKIKVILNGVPDFWFERSKKEFTNNPTILFPIRINHTEYTFLEKGHDRAYEILSQLKTPKKIFINHFGSLESVIKSTYLRIIENKVKAEVVQGLNNEELQKQYYPGDIFLSTSRTEACQLSLIEAMASKMISVTYPVGIAPSVINNGENGFLVNSPKQAIDVISKLLVSPSTRAKIGLNAFRDAAKKFRFKRMIKEYRQTFKQIVR